MSKNTKINYKTIISCLSVVVIPLIVQIVISESTLSSYAWFSDSGREVDFFLIGKMYGILILAPIMFLIGAFTLTQNPSIYKKRLLGNKYLIYFALIYMVCIIVSTFFAENIKEAWLGGYAQHESALILISYLVFCVFAYMFLENEDAICSFLKIALCGVAVISLIGFCQWVRYDFFTTMIGKSLISALSEIQASQISLSFEEGRVYMTLYNPNYVGSYVALVLPVVIASCFILQKMWQRIGLSAIIVMLVCSLIGSKSTTGMTAIMCSVVLFIILSIPRLAKHSKQIWIIVASVVCVIGMIGVVNHDSLTQAIEKYRFQKDNFVFDKILLHEECVELQIRGDSLYIQSSEQDGEIYLSLYDMDHKPIQDMSAYEGVSVRAVNYADSTKGFAVEADGIILNFYHDEKKGVYYYHNVYGKNVTECADSESIGFDGYEQFASHRGFIWSRSLPLLKQNILFGCGPDQFVYEFPNDDYLSLLNNGYYGEIVTKPHNMYLQMGVQTGVVSLIAFILFYILYCIQSIKLLWKTKDISVSYIISEAVLIGSFGYMVTGIANDSTIGVAPVFWTFIGVGIACNFILKNKKEMRR